MQKFDVKDIWIQENEFIIGLICLAHLGSHVWWEIREEYRVREDGTRIFIVRNNPWRWSDLHCKGKFLRLSELANMVRIMNELIESFFPCAWWFCYRGCWSVNREAVKYLHCGKIPLNSAWFFWSLPCSSGMLCVNCTNYNFCNKLIGEKCGILSDFDTFRWRDMTCI